MGHKDEFDDGTTQYQIKWRHEHNERTNASNVHNGAFVYWEHWTMNQIEIFNYNVHVSTNKHYFHHSGVFCYWYVLLALYYLNLMASVIVLLSFSDKYERKWLNNERALPCSSLISTKSFDMAVYSIQDDVHFPFIYSLRKRNFSDNARSLIHELWIVDCGWCE